MSPNNLNQEQLAKESKFKVFKKNKNKQAYYGHPGLSTNSGKALPS